MNVLIQLMLVIGTLHVPIQLDRIHADVIRDLLGMEQIVLVCNSYLSYCIERLAEAFLNYNCCVSCGIIDNSLIIW